MRSVSIGVQLVRTDREQNTGRYFFVFGLSAATPQRMYRRSKAISGTPCYPYELAAWRLRRHIQRDQGDVWTRVANYHSREPEENAKYRSRLVAKAANWEQWLAARFATDSVADPTVEGERHGKERAVSTNERKTVGARRERESGESDRQQLDTLIDQLDAAGASGPMLQAESRSIGLTHAGVLLGGVQLPRHRTYRLINPSRAWGTSTTVEALVDAFDSVAAIDPAAPRVEVHDLSLRRGGLMRGHKSHQSGRDVDITYYQRRSRGACTGRRVRPDDLDALREWRLLRHWLERGQAEFIFVDYALQRPLYEVAEASGATGRELAEWFQYPRGPGVRAGIIRHVPNHADHVHVRFRWSSVKCATAGVHERNSAEDDLLEIIQE